MAGSGRFSHAIVVLPPGAGGRVEDASLRRWLSRGSVSLAEPRQEMLPTVLQLLDVPAPQDGLAALRFWGQTGERSTAWIAAADPIHLETRLHSLRIRALPARELPGRELRVLFDSLQATLGDDSAWSFARLGNFGYLRGTQEFDSAPVSAAVLHGLSPDEFLPEDASSGLYHRVLGEVQMVLHDHDINAMRADAGRLPVNSLWLWGGGVAPEIVDRPLPALFANDALFRGFWLSCGQDVLDWDTGFAEAASNSPAGFVAVVPEEESAAMTAYLEQLRKAMSGGTIRSLTLLFRDGLTVRISRWNGLRFWCGVSPLLQEGSSNE